MAERWGSDAPCLAGNPALICCLPARRGSRRKTHSTEMERHPCHPGRGHGPTGVLGLLVLPTAGEACKAVGTIWGRFSSKLVPVQEEGGIGRCSRDRNNCTCDQWHVEPPMLRCHRVTWVGITGGAWSCTIPQGTGGGEMEEEEGGWRFMPAGETSVHATNICELFLET